MTALLRPCDKKPSGRTGSVMELSNSDLITDIVLGHGVGHYLGLSHAGDIINLMGDNFNGNRIGSMNSTSLNLTNNQGNTMKNHCSVSNC